MKRELPIRELHCAKALNARDLLLAQAATAVPHATRYECKHNCCKLMDTAQSNDHLLQIYADKCPKPYATQ